MLKKYNSRRGVVVAEFARIRIPIMYPQLQVFYHVGSVIH